MTYETPFIVDVWDVLLCALSVLVRFMFAMTNKIKEKGPNFKFKVYFDARHLVRWGGHLITSVVFLLFLPEIYIEYIAPKYLPEVPYWSFAGDFLIGFAGYDLIKFLEKVTSPIIEKISGKKI